MSLPNSSASTFLQNYGALSESVDEFEKSKSFADIHQSLLLLQKSISFAPELKSKINIGEWNMLFIRISFCLDTNGNSYLAYLLGKQSSLLNNDLTNANLNLFLLLSSFSYLNIHTMLTNFAYPAEFNAFGVFVARCLDESHLFERNFAPFYSYILGAVSQKNFTDLQIKSIFPAYFIAKLPDQYREKILRLLENVLKNKTFLTNISDNISNIRSTQKASSEQKLDVCELAYKTLRKLKEDDDTISFLCLLRELSVRQNITNLFCGWLQIVPDLFTYEVFARVFKNYHGFKQCAIELLSEKNGAGEYIVINYIKSASYRCDLPSDPSYFEEFFRITKGLPENVMSAMAKQLLPVCERLIEESSLGKRKKELERLAALPKVSSQESQFAAEATIGASATTSGNQPTISPSSAILLACPKPMYSAKLLLQAETQQNSALAPTAVSRAPQGDDTLEEKSAWSKHYRYQS